MATNGFKITNINFRTTDYELEKGQYIYSLEIKPTGTSFNFGFSYKGSSTVNTVSVTGLTANVRQKVEKVFNLTNAVDKFYPCRQINAEIFQPVINKGTKAIDPSVNPDDASAGIKIEVDRLTLQVSQKTDASEVSTMISQSATDIKLAVKNDLDETGIDIANRKVTIKADTFEVKDNSNNPHLVFKLDNNGQPILRTSMIDTDNLVAKKVQTPFLGTNINNTTQFRSDLTSGRNVKYSGTGVVGNKQWINADLPIGTGIDGLNVNIHAAEGTLKRFRLRNTSGGRIVFKNNSFNQIDLVPEVMQYIQMIASSRGSLIDWHVTAWDSFIYHTSAVDGWAPAMFFPGDVILRLSIGTQADATEIENNWLTGYSISRMGDITTITMHESTYYNESGGGIKRDLMGKVEAYACVHGEYAYPAHTSIGFGAASNRRILIKIDHAYPVELTVRASTFFKQGIWMSE